jgi:hypothetical protein
MKSMQTINRREKDKEASTVTSGQHALRIGHAFAAVGPYSTWSFCDILGRLSCNLQQRLTKSWVTLQLQLPVTAL